MKHATGLETCTRIHFLFIFNLVQMRICKIRKTLLFCLYILMTSLWAFIEVCLVNLELPSKLFICLDVFGEQTVVLGELWSYTLNF